MLQDNIMRQTVLISAVGLMIFLVVSAQTACAQTEPAPETIEQLQQQHTKLLQQFEKVKEQDDSTEAIRIAKEVLRI